MFKILASFCKEKTDNYSTLSLLWELRRRAKGRVVEHLRNHLSSDSKIERKLSAFDCNHVLELLCSSVHFYVACKQTVLLVHSIASAECGWTSSSQAVCASGVRPGVMAITGISIKREVQLLLAPLITG